MKKAILILCGIFLTSPLALAHVEYDPGYSSGGSYESSYPDYSYPDTSYSRNISCSAYDSGWEEHWGGHSTCESCKSKHGSCTKICQETYYTCTAIGTDGFGDDQRSMEFTVSDSSQWTARQKAEDRCWRATRGSCTVDSCTSNNEEVSRNRCN